MKGNFERLVHSEVPVLIDFYANWCAPCRALAPVLQEVAREMQSRLKILKIDVDKNQELSRRYQVKGVPTLILFKHGEVFWRTSGLVDKKRLLEIIGNSLKQD